jgi:hypothetical protein
VDRSISRRVPSLLISVPSAFHTVGKSILVSLTESTSSPIWYLSSALSSELRKEIETGSPCVFEANNSCDDS